MDLPLPGVIGAAVGVGVGLLDYGIIASLIRRTIARQKEQPDPARVDLVMKGVFVVNAVVFAALGWWVGVSVSGIGVPPA
jgi:hypothetical protein